MTTSYRTPGPLNLWENHFEENGEGSWIRKSVPSTEEKANPNTNCKANPNTNTDVEVKVEADNDDESSKGTVDLTANGGKEDADKKEAPLEEIQIITPVPTKKRSVNELDAALKKLPSDIRSEVLDSNILLLLNGINVMKTKVVHETMDGDEKEQRLIVRYNPCAGFDPAHASDAFLDPKLSDDGKKLTFSIRVPDCFLDQDYLTDERMPYIKNDQRKKFRFEQGLEKVMTGYSRLKDVEGGYICSRITIPLGEACDKIYPDPHFVRSEKRNNFMMIQFVLRLTDQSLVMVAQKKLHKEVIDLDF